MKRKHGWLIVLAVVLLLVAACGSERARPTPRSQIADTDLTSEEQETAPPPFDKHSPTLSAEPAERPASAEDGHVLGSPGAPVTIVEYSDFQWPYCARYVRETFPQIKETYIEAGQVRYIFKHFPLYSIHPHAAKAAEAAECAGEQRAFWEMHDALFASQGEWTGKQNATGSFKRLAGDLGLDHAQFDACLDGGIYATRVTADYQNGLLDGAGSTPTFLINGVPLIGAHPFAAFEQRIDYYLAGGGPPVLEVAADSFRSLGEPDAPVVVTEFSDFQWPYCAQTAREVVPALIERYVGSGLIRFVYREFPMVQNHPAAQRASEAAVCAGKLDHYWEMNGKLYASAGEWGAQGVDPDSSFKRYARELGLDAAAFDECLDSGEAAIFVRGDMMAGEILGVDATPYFFVNDIPIRGARSIDALGQIIEYAAIGGRIPEIVPTGDDFHVRGDRETAKAVMVAFVDYANPESAQHALEVLPKLVATYVDAGNMLFVLHPWPDKDGTPGAQAAGAAECAGQQGKFWEMHDRLFDQQTLWTAEAEPRMLVNGYAESLGLDTSAFEACLDSNWAKLRVRAGGVVGALYGMPEPPIYLFNNGQALQESPTFEEFKAQIDSILNP